MCRGRRSRPIMPAEAEAGLRPRTCMYVNARGRRPKGIYVRACPRPRAGRGRGRRDRPRPEAETSMFCARMSQPRFHMRVNARTGPSCIQHGRDLRRNKYMHECTHMHQHACCIILAMKGFFNNDCISTCAQNLPRNKWRFTTE
eukprot:365895-Chlamydomonas_euryale.AAC.7